MKYEHIASVLGWAETPESSEGLFLQNEEATAIEKALSESASVEDLSTANNRITELTQEVQTATQQLDVANEKVTEHEATIAELNTKLTEYGGKASGNGTTITTEKDDKVIDTGNGSDKITLNHPEHPLNQAAAKKAAATK
jgi:uncharacterized protein YlxW (UPF0749 family)